MALSIWPEGTKFAFTVVDDPDAQRLEGTRLVYDFLGDLGFRTSKMVWSADGHRVPFCNAGVTCEDPEYLRYVQGLHHRGFEIGWHMSSFSTSDRIKTQHALDRFRERFGNYPRTMSNHVGCEENMYWGDARFTGAHRAAYNLATGFRNKGRFFGHVAGDPRFWGDLCRKHIRYCRNFTFPTINTLAACPDMPYHDPDRPFVDNWYSASEGATVERFCHTIRESEQDKLEEQGGACIIYTHFGFGFEREDGVLDPRFKTLMERLARKAGWFVPVGTLLDYLMLLKQSAELPVRRRAALERRWFVSKLRTRRVS